jgi:hypothetical protein
MTASLLIRFGRRTTIVRRRNLTILMTQRLAAPRFRAIAVRSYSTGDRRRSELPSLTESITGVLGLLRNYLPTITQAVFPPTPVQTTTTTTAPTAPPTPPPTDPWAGESSWRAIDRNNQEQVPGPFEVLHRGDNTAPEVLFQDGMPSPGNNFRLADHQVRSGDRTGTNDAFYGTTVAAAHSAEETGPLFEDGHRYLVVLHGAFGCQVGKQVLWAEIIEYEIVVHIVPPHKIVAVLDKNTGIVHVNPGLAATATAATADRLSALYQVLTRRRER